MSFRHRLIRLTALTSIVIATTGCTITFGAQPPAQTEVGVLIGEDGMPYMGLATCAPFKVTSMTLWYVTEFRPNSLGSDGPPALRYEFDPPVPRSRALGALNPDAKISGGTISTFNESEFTDAMDTRSQSDPDHYPRAIVKVEYLTKDGNPDANSTSWYADLNKPGTWNTQRQMDTDALKWKCDGEPAWDFSVVG